VLEVYIFGSDSWDFKVIKDLEEFKKMSGVIIANRYER